MNMQRDLLPFVILTTAAVTPAFAQAATPAAVSAGTAAHGAASIPDFSRVWNHPAFPWFEPPASGPGPITNLSRWPEQRPQTEGGFPHLDRTAGSLAGDGATMTNRAPRPRHARERGKQRFRADALVRARLRRADDRRAREPAKLRWGLVTIAYERFERPKGKG